MGLADGKLDAEDQAAKTEGRPKRALVIGCSRDCWLETWQAKQLCEFDAFYVCKLSGVYWEGGFFHWIGLHPEWIAKYKQDRAALGHHADYETIAPLAGEVGMHGRHPVDRRITYRYPGMNASASSGGYAAKVALDDGFTKVVLAGVPMQPEASHFTRGQPWLQRDSFMRGFMDCLPHFKGKVRSMSGWTAEQLQMPTKEWLAE